VEHIDSFIEQFAESDLNCSVSVTTSDKHPLWMFAVDNDFRLRPFIQGPISTNRQELPPAYAMNGALYMANIPWLQEKRTFLTDETKGFYMQPEHSLDIDTETDFLFCNFLLENNLV
jgi:CMP-N-acetylneuraminic acid synthetase